MTPDQHSALSVRDFGGEVKDYIEIHKFLDQTKFHFSDFRHRAILHNTLGMKLCEDIFGPAILNSNGHNIPVREVARRHILQDCGTVPTVKDTLLALEKGEYMKYNNPLKKDLTWLKVNY